LWVGEIFADAIAYDRRKSYAVKGLFLPYLSRWAIKNPSSHKNRQRTFWVTGGASSGNRDEAGAGRVLDVAQQCSKALDALFERGFHVTGIDRLDPRMTVGAGEDLGQPALAEERTPLGPERFKKILDMASPERSRTDPRYPHRGRASAISPLRPTAGESGRCLQVFQSCYSNPA
jgi:hypothetical protein